MRAAPEVTTPREEFICAPRGGFPYVARPLIITFALQWTPVNPVLVYIYFSISCYPPQLLSTICSIHFFFYISIGSSQPSCRCNKNKDNRFTLSTSSSTVNVLEVRTVPLVVKHLIAGFLLLAKARATLALSATLATCSGSKVALEAGGQSLASAPLARPSSSFRTATEISIFRQFLEKDSVKKQRFLLVDWSSKVFILFSSFHGKVQWYCCELGWFTAWFKAMGWRNSLGRGWKFFHRRRCSRKMSRRGISTKGPLMVFTRTLSTPAA